MRKWNKKTVRKAAVSMAAVVAFSSIQADCAVAGVSRLMILEAPQTEAAGGQTASSQDANSQAAGGQAADGDVLDDAAVIEITSTEEFLQFAKDCTKESFSKGNHFVLQADINLQGTSFSPIAVFAGEFDGNGHSVVGLSILSSGSNLGLFRFVEEGATVKNLKVNGTIMPVGSRTNIGGIVGTNRGTIENCTFTGEIMAQESLGGIAGYNEETGVITGCASKAMMTGNLKTGGIAGYNEGLIEKCVNRGEVNTSDAGVIDPEDGQFSVEGLDLEGSLRVEKVNDAGGIAGLSLGTIKECTNYGSIGYPHVGYNLGGIVGRQSGLIFQCKNYGTVQSRKDAGGIVGQFEPDVTINYEEDTIGKLEDQLDRLSDMGDALSRILEDTTDTTTDNLDKIDARVDNVRDIGKFYKDVYKKDADILNESMDNSLDEIQDILNHTDLDLVSGDSMTKIYLAKELMKEIRELKTKLRQGFEGDITDQEALKQWLEEKMQLFQTMYEKSEQLKENLVYLAGSLPSDAVGGVEEFEDDMDDLVVEVNVLTDILRQNRDSIRDDIECMDEELTEEVDLLSGDMDTLSNDLKSSKDQIRNQKRQIEDQIDLMRDTLSDGIEKVREDQDLYEDISDVEEEELTDGMVVGCSNEGQITADYQSGGIVGIIGMELSLDPEQDLEADEERTLNMTRNAKAVVVGCINNGEIQVKNDYVGGIAGKANLGALIQNQNYGNITAEEGNYAGGITGSSAYVLRQNYSMCSITGNDYLGGIAGWAKDVKENYALSSLESEGERIGSIAGDMDDEGVMEGNFYVDEGVGALDGITYESQASGIPYEEFVDLEQVPDRFRHLTVSFLVEGEVIKTVECPYGGALKETDIPQIPQKDGYYYEWEEKDLSCVKVGQKVHAVYKPWHTTIASSDDKMPLMLAEANFYPGTALKVKEVLDPSWQSPEDYRIVKGYEYSILQPEEVSDPEKVIVRLLAEDMPEEAAIGMINNDTVTLVDAKWDGSYLVFETDGEGTFALLTPHNKIVLWRLLAAGVAVILIVVVFIVLKGKKGKKKAAPEENKQPEEGQPGVGQPGEEQLENEQPGEEVDGDADE